MLDWMKRLLPKTINARFDIAQTNADNRKHWANADSLSARASMSPAVRRVIRIRSRYESENNSWYSGVLRTATNHIVGCGPRLQVLTDNPEANTRLERAFGNWCRKIQLADKLRTAVEAYWRDGEVFFMRSERPRNYPMTLDLRTFETEQVASPMMGSILSDPFVDDGIRFDQATNEIEYHVFDRHPGGINPVSTLSGQWYPSREVLHLFRAERPGQVRGLPRATPALPLLPVMRRQQMATLFSAETAANFALYLKSNSPAIDPTASPADFAEIEMARNMLTTLPSGWDIGQVEPKQPGPNYKEFQDHTLKSFARCTNMPYPLAAGTAQDSNFSSFKGDMRNVWRPEVLSEQDRIETSIIEPIFAWFLEAAIYVPGLLDGLPQLSEINHRWHWPPLPDLDPVDTANAASIKLGSGQSTLTQIHADAGQDWETEATRAATDFGVDVATYKAALFAKTFASPGAGQSAVGAMPNATPVATAGAFTGTKRRDFTNNQKATAEVLSAMIAGTSEVLTKASLLRLGWDDAAAQSLIDDARDGAIDSTLEMTASKKTCECDGPCECDDLIACGGPGSGVPGPCPKGGATAKKTSKATRQTRATPKPSEKHASDKSLRAKASHNPSTKEKQDISEKVEHEVTTALGGTKSGDNLPMDVVSKSGKVGFEVKTLHDAKENRINMRKDSRERKEAWIKEKSGRSAYVIAVDNRDQFQGGKHASKYSGHKYYVGKGVGAFSLSSMTPARDLAHVKQIVGIK